MRDHINKIKNIRIASASVIGASHLRNITCCQDAVSIKQGSHKGEPFLQTSTADGHGGPKHTKSEDGSTLACQAAEKTGTQFLLSGGADKADREIQFAQFMCKHLQEEWIQNVSQASSHYRSDPNDLIQYGTTLLTALFYHDHLYLAQLGDGNICLLNTQGEAIFLTPPEDVGIINHVSDSLCNRSSSSRWHFACVPLNDVSFVMLSTDGLMNAYKSRDTHIKLTNTINGYFDRFSPADINEVLPSWLTSYSANGSGDDISLIAIRVSETKQKTGEQNEERTRATGNKRYQKTCRRRTRRNFPYIQRRQRARAQTVQ